VKAKGPAVLSSCYFTCSGGRSRLRRGEVPGLALLDVPCKHRPLSGKALGRGRASRYRASLERELSANAFKRRGLLAPALRVFREEEFSSRLSLPSAVHSPFLALVLRDASSPVELAWALGPPLARPEF